jgi:DNA polymerase II large subunit
MGVFMAPHNCAGVICRFIGFSKVQSALASPYLHAAVRRDCDGDEAAIMLLSDVLINFSKEFLPSHRGGTQDAPLVLNAKINAGEVDDQILDFECVDEYPLELYEMAEKGEHSSAVKINTVKDILKKDGDPFVNLGFTHDTSDFNEGVDCSSYKLLATMKEKVRHQMDLVEKIRAVDTNDVARLIIDRHFIRDIRGNLRKFSMQGFRCIACNEIMRRPPLSGVCTKCGGKLIFTIHEGGIKKYLEPALSLAKEYNLSPYLKQNLELIKRYIDSVFGKDLEKQSDLGDFCK